MSAEIDVLKVQGRDGVREDFDGVQFTVLSDLYLHLYEYPDFASQIVFTVSINTDTLVDVLGRESEVHPFMFILKYIIFMCYFVFFY